MKRFQVLFLSFLPRNSSGKWFNQRLHDFYAGVREWRKEFNGHTIASSKQDVFRLQVHIPMTSRSTRSTPAETGETTSVDLLDPLPSNFQHVIEHLVTATQLLYPSDLSDHGVLHGYRHLMRCLLPKMLVILSMSHVPAYMTQTQRG